MCFGGIQTVHTMSVRHREIRQILSLLYWKNFNEDLAMNFDSLCSSVLASIKTCYCPCIFQLLLPSEVSSPDEEDLSSFFLIHSLSRL